MRKILPAIISIVLLITLFIVTVTLDENIDRDRLQQVSTLPPYTPPSTPIVENEEKEGSETPEVYFFDGEGNKITMDRFIGKPVIMNFWASWSTPSKRELDMLQQAYNDYKDTVHFLVINTTSDARETREAADKLIADNGYTFPVYYDLDANTAKAFSVISLPFSFFIDSNGKAVAYAAAEINRYALEQGLLACIRSAEKDNATAPTETVAPTEPTDFTETTDATETTEVTETTEATEATETTEPTKATTPVNPNTAGQPEDDERTDETLAVDIA